MKLFINHQDSYSRGELLLRTFLGFLYISIPHFLAIFLFALWGLVLSIVVFFIIVFTGKYPEEIFNYMIKLMNWELRIKASRSSLVDGYPSFGIEVIPTNTWLTVERMDKYSRLLVLLRFLFGPIFVSFPHGICLLFRYLADSLLGVIAFFAILFTGKYPESIHSFRVGTIRWSTRVQLYLSYMTDNYPPFSGKE